ncbi:hypothetical protein [Helicobacter sp. T3_23-1056]
MHCRHCERGYATRGNDSIENSRNDSNTFYTTDFCHTANTCHTEQSEVSQNVNKNRDISRSRTQYDNKREALFSTKS